MTSSVPIPDSFLPSETPPNATSYQIDFTKTTPALPKYKDHFAAVIDNILTPSECNELIRLAEASTTTSTASHSEPQPQPHTPTWERAMVNVGNGKQVLATDYRNCSRIIYDTPDLASRMLARLQPFLEKYNLTTITDQPLVTGLRGRGKQYELTRLNERLRFLKYEGGEYFKTHWDAIYTTPDKSEMSFYTIHVYLNGEGEQDMGEMERERKKVEQNPGIVNTDLEGELLGGATSFVSGFADEDTKVRVFPKTGSVLLFQQNGMFHEGDPVVRGVKYTLRTDGMYRLVDS
ncbi:P4Hc [Aspergillus sclerotialis]|uniref:P4Hc n=1 Tax=Aspergillus sclerotialis TaxID=2070753 RepID=A0A3A2ZKC9_9EURO|nr:P4Hc [Aspergillus sclerotialis]